MNAMTFAQTMPSGDQILLVRDVRFGDRVTHGACHATKPNGPDSRAANRIRGGAIRKDAGQFLVAPNSAAMKVGGKAELAE